MKLSTLLRNREHYRLVIVGGGTAGCAVASKFARILPKNAIAIIEPQTKHYYQPGFTLAAAGLMSHGALIRNESSVLPRGVDWFQEDVQKFMPIENRLGLTGGQKISYDFLVIATGIDLRFDMIEGLPNGRQSVLETPGICSIYFPEGARKTQAEIGAFSGGTALFTFPNTPIKCGGAPQKICYLAEEIFRQRGIRDKSHVIYCTSLPRIFAVPKYAEALEKVIEQRGIELHTLLNLCKVDTVNRVATLQVLDASQKPTGELKQIQYDMLHIGAPCSPVPSLRAHAQAHAGEEEATQLTDPQGFVRVHPQTLQSLAHKNVFAIGDCANSPNAKTAAAISSQLKAVSQNLRAVMAQREPMAKYEGYSSCPLVVDRKHVILAEFTPQGPLETFPFNQAEPTIFAYLLKRFAMPPLYWRLLLKGLWQGPGFIRRIFHPFGGSSGPVAKEKS